MIQLDRGQHCVSGRIRKVRVTQFVFAVLSLGLMLALPAEESSAQSTRGSFNNGGQLNTFQGQVLQPLPGVQTRGGVSGGQFTGQQQFVNQQGFVAPAPQVLAPIQVIPLAGTPSNARGDSFAGTSLLPPPVTQTTIAPTQQIAPAQQFSATQRIAPTQRIPAVTGQTVASTQTIAPIGGQVVNTGDLPLVTEDWVRLDTMGYSYTPGGQLVGGTSAGSVPFNRDFQDSRARAVQLNTLGINRQRHVINPNNQGFGQGTGQGFSQGSGQRFVQQPVRTTRSTVSSAPSQRRGRGNYIGGMKAGVSVPLPKRKGTAPKPRRIAVASRNTSNQRRAPSSSRTFAVRQPKTPVRRTAPKRQPTRTANTSSTLSRLPRAASGSLVPGNALDRLAPAAPSQPAAAPAAPAKPKQTQVASAAPTPAKPANPLLVQIIFPQTSTSLPDKAKGALGTLSGKMKSDKDMRVQLLSYASDEGGNATSARRRSLSRALAVRSELISQGIDQSRILVRAKGDKAESGNKDRLDILTIN